MRTSSTPVHADAAFRLLQDERGAVYVEHLVMVSVGLLVAFVLKTAGEVLLIHFTGITTGLYLGVP